MARHGLNDLVCVPIEVLPPNTSSARVLATEKLWIHRFGSLVPSGYNVAGVRCPEDIDRWCTRRYFAWHDIHHRVYVCYQAYSAHYAPRRLSRGSEVSFFAGYRLHTLAKMYAALTLRYDVNGVPMPAEGKPIAGHNSVWQVPTWFLGVLESMLAVVLKDRALAPHLKRNLPTFFLTSCWHGAFHHIDFKAALRAPDSLAFLASLPVDLQDAIVPMLSVKFPAPLGVHWRNTARLARSLTDASMDAILREPCMCHPSHPWYGSVRPFFKADCFLPGDNSYPHVMSFDYDFAMVSPPGLPPAPPDVRWLYKLGPKYRPSKRNTVWMSGGVKARLKQELSASMDKWLKSVVAAHRTYKQPLQLYAAHVKSLLYTEIDRLQNGRIYTADAKPHSSDACFPIFGIECDAHMAQLQEQTVITVLDKLPDTFCAMCKKCYVASVLHNLNTGETYQLVVGSEVSPTSEAAQSLMQAARQLAPYLFDTVSDATLKDRMSVLPIAAATVQSHKPTAALRYLACSQNTGLTEAAQWCTRLLSAIEPALIDAWKSMMQTIPVDILHRIGIDPEDARPWFIKNSKEVVRLVNRFSQEGMSLADFNLGGGFRALDVEQLCVKIHLDDLVM